MKKNRKSNNGPINQYPVDFPEIVDMDALAYAVDEDLKQRNYTLSMERDQVLRAGLDPVKWEVELAYVYREMGIRESRRITHDRYLRSNPEANYANHNDHDLELN